MYYWHRSCHGNVMMPVLVLLVLIFLGTSSFFSNRLTEPVHPLVASIMAKFEQILWECFEIFWNKVLRIIKTVNKHYRHNWLISKENDEVWKCSFILKWFDSIWKCVQKKEGDCFDLACVHQPSLPFLYVIWSTPTNVTKI